MSQGHLDLRIRVLNDGAPLFDLLEGIARSCRNERLRTLAYLGLMLELGRTAIPCAAASAGTLPFPTMTQQRSASEEAVPYIDNRVRIVDDGGPLFRMLVACESTAGRAERFRQLAVVGLMVESGRMVSPALVNTQAANADAFSADQVVQSIQANGGRGK